MKRLRDLVQKGGTRMAKAKKKAAKKAPKGGFSEILKGGLDGSKRSLERIEAEGEKLLKNLSDFADKHIPESQKKAVDDLSQQAVKYFGQINVAVEESTKRVVEKINVPTKKEFDEYNKKVRGLIEETVKVRLEKLKVPTGKEFDSLSKQMKKNADEQIKKVLGRLNIATKKDVETVAKDVKKLRKEVKAIAKPAAPKTASKK